MLPIIKELKLGQEISLFHFGPIERRVRRVKTYLYQVFDINWQHQKCWHVAYEVSAVLSGRVSENTATVFQKKWGFWEGPKATGYQSKQNIILKQRIFHDARRFQRRQSPKLLLIMGGKSVSR